MRAAYAMIVLTVIAALAAGEPPSQPKSSLAVAAIHKGDAAAKTAQENFDSAMFKARKTEIDELRIALKIARKNADLEEANSITSKINAVETEMAGSGSDASAMLGAWKTQYEGKDIHWSITATAVRREMAGDKPGIPQMQGHVMMVKWPTGFIERLTFVDDKFFVETWGPGHAITEPPLNVAVGVRDTGGK